MHHYSAYLTSSAHSPLLLYSLPQDAQHFLYFFPLPHGQASLRPGLLLPTTGTGGFSSLSKPLISSGCSGSTVIEHAQPRSSQTALSSDSRSEQVTRICAGFFSVPSFASLRPPKIIPWFCLLTCGIFRGLNTLFPMHNPFAITTRLPVQRTGDITTAALLQHHINQGIIIAAVFLSRLIAICPISNTQHARA
jgi:hypothetical protein